jgi:hypothetical protein
VPPLAEYHSAIDGPVGSSSASRKEQLASGKTVCSAMVVFISSDSG